MPLTYREDTGDWGPNATAASLREGRASWAYKAIGINSYTAISQSLVEIFGTTSLQVGGGGLNRTLPASHPMFPFWYAKSIASIKGCGGGAQAPYNAQPNLEAPTIAPQWAMYPEYQYIIDFGPVPYAVIGNNNIKVTSGTWVPYNGGTPVTFWYAPEWMRFTNWIPEPQYNYVTYQQGNMIFNAIGDAPANNQPFAGYPRIFLPDQLLTFYWYGVPLRYITSQNSYLNRLVGKVNQNAWYIPAGPGSDIGPGIVNTGATNTQEQVPLFKPGSLLYLGYHPTPYAPPLPNTVTTSTGTNYYSQDKLVDLQIKFLWTTRTSSDAPSIGTLSNNNWIPAGHNLLPWHADRQFHYANVVQNLASIPPIFPVPSWLSFPVEVLFTDPDTVFSSGIQP